MSTFTCILSTPDDKELPYSITIHDSGAGLIGEMDWSGTLVALKNVHARPGEAALYSLAKWPAEYTRAMVVVTSDHGESILSIRILGNPFDYVMRLDDTARFIEFLRQVEALEQPSPRESDQYDVDQMLDSVGQEFKHGYIYAGSNIHKNLPVMFTSCTVNGDAVSTAFPQSLPNGLGIYLPLGLFPLKQTLRLNWTIEVARVPRGAKLAVGGFRNTLKDRVFFTEYKLSSVRSYSGSAQFTI